ncbi:phospholipase D family protein [Geomonas subterranea]|uniref:Phospholipase D family protein n=1 Tax=Geomonas subterranea TaxID=2847989 RepID=A0ABX8LPB2_9BACT|nr:phospholipase D family protein [Geomonas subterranea]QXE92806.1 phospholipase D family protein [Geomonas subterranea]QXM09091.1 phospholipase D family protein [Geomonas subterranea]
MKLIANEVNNNYFREILELVPSAASIDVAVAYITDNTLFDLAIKHDKPLNIWCRIDEGVSLDTLSVLQKCVRHPKCKIRATYDYLHAKVIWLHGVGCYIGSANLSGKALYDNIELGVFYEEGLEFANFFGEIKTFIANLQDYTSTILPDDLNRIQKIFIEMGNSRDIENIEYQLRQHKKKFLDEWNKLKGRIFANQKTPLHKISKGSKHQKRCIEEWKYCQKILTEYADIYMAEYKRPAWVGQIDCFSEIDKMFDWYYGDYIKGDKKVEILIEEHHEQNKSNPDKKMRELFSMWTALKEVPYAEISESFATRTPIVRKLLSKKNILSLSVKDISEVVVNCWALIDHINQFKSYEKLGLDSENGKVSKEIKAEQYAKLFLCDPNKHGKSFLEVLNYFIWDESSPPWEKIWECTDSNSKWKYPGIDRSTLGELIGLARPDKYPIRNNRISRVLYALGFEVDHF